MIETFYRVLIIIACFIVGYLCGSIPNGVIISKLKRAGEEVAYTLETKLDKHDVLTLAGPVDDVEGLVSRIGKPVRQSDETGNERRMPLCDRA